MCRWCKAPTELVCRLCGTGICPACIEEAAYESAGYPVSGCSCAWGRGMDGKPVETISVPVPFTMPNGTNLTTVVIGG